MIIVVADFFSTDVIGGAELTSDALLSVGFSNYRKIRSLELTKEHIKKWKNNKWIFFNFSNVKEEIILEISKEINNYSVVEYDYKYCKYRLKSLHKEIEGFCNCENELKGKLTAIFFVKAKNLFFMSSKQKEEYEKLFPVLKKHKSSFVLSSSFLKEDIEYLKTLKNNAKNDTYLILDSRSWVKGTRSSIEYAIKNKLKFELVSGLSHEDFLKKLSFSKGLIFLPNGYDTCPRIVIEAKMLGCDIIMNDNVQHKSEDWFVNFDSIIKYIDKQKKLFYDMCLKQVLFFEERDKKINFHFIVPGYNVENWLHKCLWSIKSQEYDNYSVTFINDASTDLTKNIFENFSHDTRFKIVNNNQKKYALKNITEALNDIKCDKEDIIIILDADDWLSSPNVLQFLNYYYQQNDCLLTYGSYMYYPNGEMGQEPSEYPKHIIEQNNYRKDKWRASHLRTFRKVLWDKIDQSDFVDVDGEFYKSSYDQAIMLPMLEMAGDKAKFINDVLHVYNRKNPLNVDKLNAKQQFETMNKIRNKKRYKRINFED